MHMSDALLTPEVGAALWAGSAVAVGYCCRRVQADPDGGRLPLMGVLGAFIFAAQMVNFAIPGTGASGHLGGEILLCALLGPHAAVVVAASVLTIQALFFADGGILALGANIFNQAVVPCLVVFPLVCGRQFGSQMGSPGAIGRCAIACLLGLQFGALGVVLQTVAAGISGIPLKPFLALMQPIHLAIGVAEAAATGGMLVFLARVQPDLFWAEAQLSQQPNRGPGRVVAGFALLAVLTGGVLSAASSPKPDGLEWSLEGVARIESPSTGTTGAVHGVLDKVQARLSLFPGYVVASSHGGDTGHATQGSGTGMAGLVGGCLTLGLVVAAGWVVRRRAMSAGRAVATRG